MHFPCGKTTTKKKADERRIETTFDTLNNRMFFFSVLSPSFFRPFLSLRLLNKTTECVYFKHITETIRLEKKKKKKREKKRRVVVVYV